MGIAFTFETKSEPPVMDTAWFLFIKKNASFARCNFRTAGDALAFTADWKFKLGVEEPEDGVGEAFGLDLRPVLEAIGGQIDLVDGLLVPGMGVDPLSAHVAVGAVHFVRDCKRSRLLGNGVYLGIDFLSSGLVGLLGPLFVQIGDLIQQRLFLFGVDGSEARGALEQEVLQVMGESRVGGGVVLASRPRYYLGVEARFLAVRADVYGQPVFQAIHVYLHAAVGIRIADRAIRIGCA